LSIVTLTLGRIVTVAAITAANTARTKLLFDTEWREFKAPIVGVWIAICALVLYAIVVKAIIALRVIDTGDTAHCAVVRLKTECRRCYTAAIVCDVAFYAGLTDTLARIIPAMLIGIARDARVTRIANDADRCLRRTPVICAQATRLTCPCNTGWKVCINTVAITEACRAGDPAVTKRRIPAAASMAVDITEGALAAHTLASPNLITISVSNTANALAPIGYADRRRPAASGVIAWIARGTDGIDALLAVTIAIAETRHALTAVGHTDGGITTAAGVIICPIAELALLTDTLQTVTVAVVLTANTA
jgi:hypothetical protein